MSIAVINSKIGFMQGRFSPLVDGKIQAFPWQHWRTEFELAKQHDFSLLEWTLDQERLYENPLLTDIGQQTIRQLCSEYNVQIASLTGDCFMQAPFYKAQGKQQSQLLQDLMVIIEACASLQIKLIVFPLVDNGRLENSQQKQQLIAGLKEVESLLERSGVKIIFESDFAPQVLKTFIEEFNPSYYGINYDIGNSAALGYDPSVEINQYGKYICNVHVKDRVLHGTTVPLGNGAADFTQVFAALKQINYQGNYILQTARAADNEHSAALCRYRDQVVSWICN